MNETIKTILGRHSIRKYKDTPVPRELLDILVDCGKFAATARGIQPWFFSVVTDRAVLDRISKCNRDFILSLPEGAMTERARDPAFDNFHHAPAAIIISGCCGDNPEEFTIADCANAAENICIGAEALGLGSCYIASFKFCLSGPDGDWMYSALKIPNGYEPYYAVSLGYPDETLGERAPRRENLVAYIG